MVPRKHLIVGIVALTLAASSVGISAANESDPPARTLIVGGVSASQDYPFMGAVSVNGDFSCGASLIDTDLAVGAAHCVQDDSGKDLDPTTMKIRFNTKDRETGGVLAQVEKFTIAPGFDLSGKTGENNDLAVYKLSEAVDLEPVAIAEASPPPGAEIRVLGFGTNCAFKAGCEKEDSPLLRELKTTLDTDDACQTGFDAETELCVKGTPENTECFGDSGGPALVSNGTTLELVGAVSRGLGADTAGAADCGNGSIFTDVTAFRTLIDEVRGQGDQGNNGNSGAPTEAPPAAGTETPPPPPPAGTEAPPAAGTETPPPPAGTEPPPPPAAGTEAPPAAGTEAPPAGATPTGQVYGNK